MKASSTQKLPMMSNSRLGQLLERTHLAPLKNHSDVPASSQGVISQGPSGLRPANLPACQQNWCKMKGDQQTPANAELTKALCSADLLTRCLVHCALLVAAGLQGHYSWAAARRQRFNREHVVLSVVLHSHSQSRPSQSVIHHSIASPFGLHRTAMALGLHLPLIHCANHPTVTRNGRPCSSRVQAPRPQTGWQGSITGTKVKCRVGIDKCSRHVFCWSARRPLEALTVFTLHARPMDQTVNLWRLSHAGSKGGVLRVPHLAPRMAGRRGRAALTDSRCSCSSRRGCSNKL